MGRKKPHHNRWVLGLVHPAFISQIGASRLLQPTNENTMSKWREPTRRVLEKLEDILGTYESFICGRASASNARHTFDDELVPWTEPKKRRGSSPDYAAVY